MSISVSARGYRISLSQPHYVDFLSGRLNGDWLEVISENLMESEVPGNQVI